MTFLRIVGKMALPLFLSAVGFAFGAGREYTTALVFFFAACLVGAAVVARS